MNEGKSNAKIQEYLVSIGGYVIKTIATNRSGTHDIFCCLEGRFITVEGKAEQGKSSALQETKAHEVWRAGGFSIVGAKTVADVAEAIDVWKANDYIWPEPEQIRENLRFTL